jgi:hypothetical protein
MIFRQVDALPMARQDRFDRSTLEGAFQALGQMAAKAGRLVEIAVYGGSALVLTLPNGSRRGMSTR